MASPKEVKYPQYRQFEAARIEASNSMMALLAGAQLARHLLRLTEGSNRLLPEVFPQVQHRLPTHPHSSPDSIASPIHSIHLSGHVTAPAEPSNTQPRAKPPERLRPENARPLYATPSRTP
jgi:hypothetical protein